MNERPEGMTEEHFEYLDDLVKLATWLLRTTGATVEYGVRRVKSKQIRGQGTTLLATPKLKEARSKYATVRVADTDTITITVAAVIAQRHGTVEAGDK